MTNPRNTVDFTEIDSTYVSYKHGAGIVYDATKVGGSAQVGLAVTQTGEADSTVNLVAAGERVVGKLLKVEADGHCLVQTEGYCTLPAGSDGTLTIGMGIVGDVLIAAEGYIKAANTAGITRGEIVNNDVTTAVMVHLD